jgi:predicted branched-subunit amino acid permease
MSKPNVRDSAPDAAAERRAAFREGVRDYLPALPALVAWGVVTGVAMVQSGLALAYVLGLGATAFAASAQLASVPLMVSGAPLWAIVLTALMTNLRFVIYSAALKNHLQHLSWRRRLLLSYLVGDMLVVMFLRKVQQRPDWPERDAYFLGIGVLNLAVWHTCQLIGIFGAAWIPRDWGFELAGTLALLALVLPACARVPGAAGALAAALVGVATLHWPARLGLVDAIAAGVVVAMLAESWRERGTAAERA